MMHSNNKSMHPKINIKSVEITTQPQNESQSSKNTFYILQILCVRLMAHLGNKAQKIKTISEASMKNSKHAFSQNLSIKPNTFSCQIVYLNYQCHDDQITETMMHLIIKAYIQKSKSNPLKSLHKTNHKPAENMHIKYVNPTSQTFFRSSIYSPPNDPHKHYGTKNKTIT